MSLEKGSATCDPSKKLTRKEGKKIPLGIKKLVRNLVQAAKWIVTRSSCPYFTPTAACRCVYIPVPSRMGGLILVFMAVLGSCNKNLLLISTCLLSAKHF